MTNKPVPVHEGVLRPRHDLGVRNLLPQWRAMFSARYLAQDVGAGITVACVAIPLSLAIALASGVPPEVGLVTAIIASLVVPFLNGTPLAVAGPAAALAVLVGTIVEDHGLSGLIFVGLIAGGMQLVTGALGLGRFIRLVPASVVHGFTAGIGAIIILQQLPRVFGFAAPDEGHILSVFIHLGNYVRNADGWSVVFALGAMAVTMFVPRFAPRVPAALLIVGVLTGAVWVFGMPVEQLGALPSSLPMPSFPTWPDHGIIPLVGDALVIWAVASLETLLSSAAVDKLEGSGSRHDPDQELIGQGAGNIASAFFGGIPVTGVIARSSVNVVAGGKTRRSALIHAVVLLIAVFLLSDAMAYIPIAALAGVLLAVGARMASPAAFRELLRTSPTDGIVYLVTFGFIVIIDLLAGIQAGIVVALVIAAFRLGGTRVSIQPAEEGHARVAFRGPLTFLASIRIDTLLDRLDRLDLDQGLVIDLRGVTHVDATGVEAVLELVEHAQRRDVAVAVLGARAKVRETLESADTEAILRGRLGTSWADIEEVFAAEPGARSHLAHGAARHRDDHADLFTTTAKGTPHTLFVSCSDSRVSPTDMTGADPGELFVLRNMGALVPGPGTTDFISELASLAYAVEVLGVRDIIVCGHSSCASAALLWDTDASNPTPALEQWRTQALRCCGDIQSSAEQDEVGRRMVLQQLQNLRAHPFVRQREEQGDLRLHAWFYDMNTPEIYEWDQDAERFEPLHGQEVA